MSRGNHEISVHYNSKRNFLYPTDFYAVQQELTISKKKNEIKVIRGNCRSEIRIQFLLPLIYIVCRPYRWGRTAVSDNVYVPIRHIRNCVSPLKQEGLLFPTDVFANIRYHYGSTVPGNLVNSVYAIKKFPCYCQYFHFKSLLPILFVSARPAYTPCRSVCREAPAGTWGCSPRRAVRSGCSAR